MKQKIINYIPALKYRWLTPFYDFVLKWIIGETRFKQQLVEQANIVSGDSVLDIGCGTATLTIMLKKFYPGADITGLDIDSEVLEIARNKSYVRFLFVFIPILGLLQNPLCLFYRTKTGCCPTNY